MKPFDLITLYETNRRALADAIEQSGGSSRLVMSDVEWVSVLTVLAQNSIVIDAYFKGK